MPGSFDFESRLRRISPLGWQVYETVRRENVPFMAGSVAFHAFLSLLPLFVLLYLVVTVFGGAALTNQVISFAESFLPSRSQEVLANALQRRTQSPSVSIIGIVVLLWGAFRLFRGLDTAFSEIYAATMTESFLEQFVDAAVAFVVLVLAVVAGIVAGAAFAFFPGNPYVRLLSPLLLALGLIVAFFPIFYLFPNVEIAASDVLPGVVIAAVGWTLLQSLFKYYLALVSGGLATGLLGGVLILLTWLYLGSFVILLGAVVNAVLVGETRKTTRGFGDLPA